jgi:excinuclease UvrABC helicase subunit UvrB
MTDSRRKAIDETTRRRRTQQEYNERNGITPQSTMKPIDMSLVDIAEADYVTVPLESDDEIEGMTPEQRNRLLDELEERMREAARKFEFEKAAPRPGMVFRTSREKSSGGAHPYGAGAKPALPSSLRVGTARYA